MIACAFQFIIIKLIRLGFLADESNDLYSLNNRFFDQLKVPSYLFSIDNLQTNCTTNFFGNSYT